MKTLSFSTLKTVATGSIVAALLAVTTGCVTAPNGYNGYDDLYEHSHKTIKAIKNTKTKRTTKTAMSPLSSNELLVKSLAWDIASKTSNIKMVIVRLR